MTFNKYKARGVSSEKEEVENAVKNLQIGIPHTFCRLYEYSSNVLLSLHADGAGTKSSLAYVYWKTTGDISVWQGLAQDAIVMNTDDLICVGMADRFFISSTIGRNKNLIPSEVIEQIIEGNIRFKEKMAKFGIEIILTGGETADIGDLVRTIVVDANALGFIEKTNIIQNSNIQVGDVIVGLSSFGKSAWEDEYNSGIGSNGLTSARHDLLNKSIGEMFPESYDPSITPYAYNGHYFLTDPSPIPGLNIGKLLLSPTRTYLPLFKTIFRYHRKDIHGMVHCTGGGQFKTLKYIPSLMVIKDNLFPIPPVFQLIMESGTTLEEMYSTFNMGHRLEIFCQEQTAQRIISISQDVGIDAQIIGYCKPFDKPAILLKTCKGEIFKEKNL
ncbi:MAG: AIR synthase-related protein [Bacteroidales bacterium]|nr:AIR synthase-related protein [Bacteroidales bacterium]